MTWRVLVALFAASIVPLSAAAKLCGDDVGGQDVPCACGDTVVSDLVLGDDPVGNARCASDALVVRANGAPRSVTIDLGGKTLRGNGQGAGLWIVYGGPGGARVVSTGGRATIEGFRDGIVAHGANTATLIEGVVVTASGRDGMRVGGPGFEVRNTEVRNAGRDAYSLGGGGFRVTGSRAVSSRRFAYFVMGRDGTIGAAGAGAAAEGSGAVGFNLSGTGHRLIDCRVSGAGKDGVHLNGMHFEIRGCVARENAGDGIGGGTGMDWLLAGNQAIDNGNNGISVGGQHITDGGGNSGSGNRGLKQRRSVAQCEINGQPCAP